MPMLRIATVLESIMLDNDSLGDLWAVIVDAYVYICSQDA